MFLTLAPALPGIFATLGTASGADGMEPLITDFDTAAARPTELAAGLVPPEAWYAVSDRVMGGVSRERADLVTVDGRMALRLTGFVSSANNGGFIMLGCPLPARFDATAWTGLRIVARGAGDGYRVTLRTGDTRRPWEHYAHALPVGPDWRTVDLPFAGFVANRALPPLDRAALSRIGLVAGGKDAPADLAVTRVSLYR